MPEITETVYCENRSNWRNWLLNNHETKKEIWLVRFKKHTGKPTVSYQDSVDEALCFGWIDGLEKRIDEEKYAQRFSPRKQKSHWTETNISRFTLLKRVGLVTKAGEEAFKRHLSIS